MLVLQELFPAGGWYFVENCWLALFIFEVMLFQHVE